MPRLHRILSVVLLIAFLTSCYRWEEHGPTPQAALAQPASSTVYITRVDGSVVPVEKAVVAGDSVVGKARAARVTIPMAEVTQVRTGGVSTWDERPA